ncbi:hypothetical protein B0A55_03560 [Friedmanniomyces simplex]|uniref:Apple domain-containing protein n=1 Tax=Friedmanniomyces simplex TaxID=329884 RepID=A0A4U0XV26_9PEZI|nr:hypothetical protein B0A55_03560 [Friedmanniomyces simplex]
MYPAYLRSPLVITTLLALFNAQVCIANAQDDLHVRAVNELVTEVIAVNRFGSMCPSLSTAAPISSVISPQPIVPLNTNIPSFAASAPASTSTSSTPTALSYTTPTHCTDPVCPLLDHDACIDAAGSTYGIICDSTLTGLVAFPPTPPRQKRGGKLQPREYTSTFTACLALCDQMGGGCRGVSWSEQGVGDGSGGNCLVYGGVTGVEGVNGTIAARRLVTYGGSGGGGGGGGTYGAGVYSL